MRLGHIEGSFRLVAREFVSASVSACVYGIECQGHPPPVLVTLDCQKAVVEGTCHGLTIEMPLQILHYTVVATNHKRYMTHSSYDTNMNYARDNQTGQDEIDDI